MTHPNRPLRLLLISTPVAPLGSGGGGGVELTIINLVKYLLSKQYSVEIVAPEGSTIPLPVQIHTMSGDLQPPAQHQGRDAVETDSANMALTKMCSYARDNQMRFDLIVSFAYDWLPIYLTPGFETPVAHFISMCSLNDAVDYEITRLSALNRNLFGCYSHIQASTFPDPTLFHVLGFGLDLPLYEFTDKADSYLVWTGRVSPEKGLEDAVRAAALSRLPLKIVGRIENEQYRCDIEIGTPTANIEFTGFLSTHDMQSVVRKAKAMLMTPHWVEAFGIVVVESLACGVPVISYKRGGPSEIIDDGITGFLVPPGDTNALNRAVLQVDSLNRQDCRDAAENSFNLDSWGREMEVWFNKIVGPLI